MDTGATVAPAEASVQRSNSPIRDNPRGRPNGRERPEVVQARQRALGFLRRWIGYRDTNGQEPTVAMIAWALDYINRGHADYPVGCLDYTPPQRKLKPGMIQGEGAIANYRATRLQKPLPPPGERSPLAPSAAPRSIILSVSDLEEIEHRHREAMESDVHLMELAAAVVAEVGTERVERAATDALRDLFHEVTTYEYVHLASPAAGRRPLPLPRAPKAPQLPPGHSYLIDCAACGETFESKRSSARTCSDRCRKALSRST